MKFYDVVRGIYHFWVKIQYFSTYLDRIQKLLSSNTTRESWRSSAEVKWTWSTHWSEGCVAVWNPVKGFFPLNTFLTVVSCVSHVNQRIEKTLTTLTSLGGRFWTESGVVGARLLPGGRSSYTRVPLGVGHWRHLTRSGGFCHTRLNCSRVECSTDTFYVVVYVKLTVDSNMLFYMIHACPSTQHSFTPVMFKVYLSLFE